jgi:hypothetical protein
MRVQAAGLLLSPKRILRVDISGSCLVHLLIRGISGARVAEAAGSTLKTLPDFTKISKPTHSHPSQLTYVGSIDLIEAINAHLWGLLPVLL